MKERVKTTCSKIKNHLSTHKVAYVLGAFSLMLMYNNVRNARELEEFLTSKGIDPNEYFLTPEDYNWLKNNS